MEACSKEEMEKFIVNCGYEYTSDIFILFTNVYIRVLCTKQTVTQHPGNTVSHISNTHDEYLCWNYKTGLRRHVSVDTFRLQFKVFQFMKENHDDFQEKLLEEILDHNLYTLAIHSEHLL